MKKAFYINPIQVFLYNTLAYERKSYKGGVSSGWGRQCKLKNKSGKPLNFPVPTQPPVPVAKSTKLSSSFLLFHLNLLVYRHETKREDYD